MNSLLKKIYRFFIPHEDNNYQAQSLHTNMLSAYLVVAVMLVFVSKQIPSFSNVLGIATDITIQKLFALTNEERTKQGLSALQENTQLAEAAQKKARHMLQKDYWSHFAPDGTSPWDFIKQSGYQYEFAGENLAKNFLFSNNVVDAWMNSATHRANMFRKEYTQVGYAVVNGMLNGEETTLVVQMFGTPINPQEQKGGTGPDLSVQKPKVLGQTQAQPQIQKQGLPVSGKRLAYDINIIFIAFIVLALILDFSVASKLNILHLRGKHIAHLLFLGFISLGILFILKQGATL